MDRITAKRVLARPLKFGDAEQITAVRRLEQESGGYEVELRVTGRVTVRVEADDEDEAEDKAPDMFDGCIDNWDNWDIEVLSVKEAEPEKALS